LRLVEQLICINVANRTGIWRTSRVPFRTLPLAQIGTQRGFEFAQPPE